MFLERLCGQGILGKTACKLAVLNHIHTQTITLNISLTPAHKRN